MESQRISETTEISNEASSEKLGLRNPITWNSIIVNPRQKGNPVLKKIKNVPWEYGCIDPDYLVGTSSCVLFLSFRYHVLHKDYIYRRVKELGKQYRLRDQYQSTMIELSKLAVISGLTLIAAWSLEEAGRYLEAFKSYENKPCDQIMPQKNLNAIENSINFFSKTKSVNKTDTVTLFSMFSNLKSIANSTKEEISKCPGLGDQKVEKLIKALETPFKRVQPKSN